MVSVPSTLEPPQGAPRVQKLDNTQVMLTRSSLCVADGKCQDIMMITLTFVYEL